MVTIFGDHRVDHHPVADQSFVDDPRRHRGGDRAGLLAVLAGALFALGHDHEVAGRFDVQLLADVVADDRGRLPAGWAGALLRSAAQHAFHAWQSGGQLLPSRMWAAGPDGRGDRLALALGLHFDAAHPGLPFQQFQLRGVELLARRAVLLDPLEPQLLFQNLDFQLRPLQLLPQFDNLFGLGNNGIERRDTHRL